MNRRSFLRRTGLLGTLALAGCTGEGNPGTTPENDSADPDDADDTQTPTDTPTPSPPTIAESTVETTRATCASDAIPLADISLPADDSSLVTFSGLLHAPDPCHEVTIESTSLDDGDTLTIVLGTEGGDEACVECVGALVFEGQVSFDGDRPDAVTVRYDETILGSTASGVETPTPRPSPSLSGTSFEVTAVGPGTEINQTDIEFDLDTNEVIVTGTISGKNGCTIAELGSAEYDPTTDSLAVDVVTTQEEGSEDAACTQSIVEIDYEMRAQFEGGLPKVVEVSHNGQGIASGAHGSASAGEAAGDSS